MLLSLASWRVASIVRPLRPTFAWKILRVLFVIYSVCGSSTSPSYGCSLVVREVYYYPFRDLWSGRVYYVYSYMEAKAVDIECLLLVVYMLLTYLPIVAVPFLVTVGVSIVVVKVVLILLD